MTQHIVQFPEKNYSARDIAELSGDGILVHSIWHSIQGEGPFAGYPAIFVRLGGCNRGAKTDACQFCDTNFLVADSKVMSIEYLVDQINMHRRDTRCELVVITGGEPLLHAKLNTLVTVLSLADYRVQIESNGDFVRLDSAPEATLVVSPKLSTHAGKYSKPHAEMLERADYLKVLVEDDPKSPYYSVPPYLAAFAENKGNDAVFISPMNAYLRPVRKGEVASMWGDLYDHEVCGRNHAYAAWVALCFNFRLSIQMHAFASVA